MSNSDFKITVKAFNEAMRAPQFLFRRSAYAAVRIYLADIRTLADYIPSMMVRIKWLLWLRGVGRKPALFN